MEIKKSSVPFKDLIDALKLIDHPEGGYYRETYRSEMRIPTSENSSNFPMGRNVSTAIYFLLPQGHFSAFHRIRSDECWHFYLGGTLLIHIIEPDGHYQLIRLGHDYANGEFFQYVVPKGCWFASEPAISTSYALVGCTVSPGFDFKDFELGDAKSLVALFPEQRNLIERLCKS